MNTTAETPAVKALDAKLEKAYAAYSAADKKFLEVSAKLDLNTGWTAEAEAAHKEYTRAERALDRLRNKRYQLTGECPSDKEWL